MWRNVGDRLYVVQRRGLDVAVIEGFAPEATVSLLESAFRAKKVEMKPDPSPTAGQTTTTDKPKSFDRGSRRGISTADRRKSPIKRIAVG